MLASLAPECGVCLIYGKQVREVSAGILPALGMRPSLVKAW
jgi:hypothetical protein